MRRHLDGREAAGRRSEQDVAGAGVEGGVVTRALEAAALGRPARPGSRGAGSGGRTRRRVVRVEPNGEQRRGRRPRARRAPRRRRGCEARRGHDGPPRGASGVRRRAGRAGRRQRQRPRRRRQRRESGGDRAGARRRPSGERGRITGQHRASSRCSSAGERRGAASTPTTTVSTASGTIRWLRVCTGLVTDDEAVLRTGARQVARPPRGVP